MKAKDYVAKYQERIMGISTADEAWSAAKDLMQELLNESEEICKARHVSLLRGQLSVLKEINNKGNTIAREIPVLKHDFFKEYVCYVEPRFKEEWR